MVDDLDQIPAPVTCSSLGRSGGVLGGGQGRHAGVGFLPLGEDGEEPPRGSGLYVFGMAIGC